MSVVIDRNDGIVVGGGIDEDLDLFEGIAFIARAVVAATVAASFSF